MEEGLKALFGLLEKAGPWAAVILLLLGALKFVNEERKDANKRVDALSDKLDAERKEHAKDYKELADKQLHSSIENNATLKVMSEVLLGRRSGA